MSKEILELIENVDPSDGDKLDLINARVFCWLEGLTLESYDNVEYGYFTVKENDDEYSLCDIEFSDGQGDYTRSRDALKSIRPEGWILNDVLYDFNSKDEVTRYCRIFVRKPYRNRDVKIRGAFLPTEELAELHAIIQAITYERENS